ncbi:MAG: amidohydrolase family protein, partial [Gemmatimonadota bacterium]|nr:amidohydrolase family protein [Gemmatimonadota bacterium]
LTAPSPDSVRSLVGDGALEVLAEVTNQYAGLPPDAPEMRPYWALAEELDIPVGIHMGPGPPGATYLAYPEYRASLGNPLLLEDVLARHPRLRVYVMHAGFPFLDDLKALLYAHPQVHVEIGVLSFTRPRADLYRFLEALVDAGFESRIMFGSDQMNWPEAIVRAIEAVEGAPFLTEAQKRAILYDNAARFLRLGPEERERHLGG